MYYNLLLVFCFIELFNGFIAMMTVQIQYLFSENTLFARFDQLLISCGNLDEFRLV